MIPASSTLEEVSRQTGKVYITYSDQQGTGENWIHGPAPQIKPELIKPNRHQRRAMKKSKYCPLCGKE